MDQDDSKAVEVVDVENPVEPKEKDLSLTLPKCFYGGVYRPALLAKEIADTMHFVCSPIDRNGRGINLLGYKDGVFSADGVSVARRLAIESLGAYATSTRVEQAIEMVKDRSCIHESKLDPHALELINVQNGLLEWKTGDLLDPHPDNLSTIRIPVKYDPKAKSEILDKFLESILPGDALQMIEEMVGYLLTPDVRQQKAFVLTGTGANGKSTFLKMVSGLLGSQNTSSVGLHELEENRFRVAQLHGKLANICADLDARSLRSTGYFKCIVTGDAITGEHKHGHPFEFRPTARLIFAANEVPKSTDRSDALFRRLVIIPFPNRFEGDKADRTLADKLCVPEVLSALLNRSLTGLRRLQERGEFELPASVVGANAEYRAKCDSATTFVKERLDRDPNSRIERSELYGRYEDWSIAEGLQPLGRADFYKRVMSELKADTRLITNDTGERVRAFVGIKWRVETAS